MCLSQMEERISERIVEQILDVPGSSRTAGLYYMRGAFFVFKSSVLLILPVEVWVPFFCCDL